LFCFRKETALLRLQRGVKKEKRREGGRAGHIKGLLEKGMNRNLFAEQREKRRRNCAASEASREKGKKEGVSRIVKR